MRIIYVCKYSTEKDQKCSVMFYHWRNNNIQDEVQLMNVVAILVFKVMSFMMSIFNGHKMVYLRMLLTLSRNLPTNELSIKKIECCDLYKDRDFRITYSCNFT